MVSEWVTRCRHLSTIFQSRGGTAIWTLISNSWFVWIQTSISASLSPDEKSHEPGVVFASYSGKTVKTPVFKAVKHYIFHLWSHSEVAKIDLIATVCSKADKSRSSFRWSNPGFHYENYFQLSNCRKTVQYKTQKRIIDTVFDYSRPVNNRIGNNNQSVHTSKRRYVNSRNIKQKGFWCTIKRIFHRF